MANTYTVGSRGCSAETTRHGKRRYCAQKWIVIRQGKQYCHYHDPENPHKFGERLKAK